MKKNILCALIALCMVLSACTPDSADQVPAESTKLEQQIETENNYRPDLEKEVVDISTIDNASAEKLLNAGQISAESSKIKWQLKSEDYNYSPDLKAKDIDCIRIADDILAGNIHVLGTFSDTLRFENAAEIDWDAQVSNSPNTFQLYLQCLNPVAFLTRAYQLTNDERYLDLAQKIIVSWLDYADSKESGKNTYTWYDHGVALRVENILYFIITANSLDLELNRRLETSLKNHGEWLYDDAHYFENHNHGVFEDTALIYLSYFLTDPQTEVWLGHAKERLTEQLKYAFSAEMVHVENSPGYATGIIELFQTVADFLTCQGDALGEMIQKDLEQAREYVLWATKPDGFLAMYGDTFGNSLNQDKQTIEMNLPIGSAFYPKSGYYYGNHANGDGAIWCSFRAGYSSKTHKHADDCSFQLYALGQDIFVDSGMYNYMTGNVYRDYMVSSKAHNSIIVDGNSYSVTAENSSKTGILKTAQTDEYDEILGFLDMYDGVSIDRHFYNFKGTIVLYDDIQSKEIHNYEQLFHLYPGIRILEQSNSEVLLQIPTDQTHYIRIRQMGGPSELQIKAGYYSETLNEVVENQVLSFCQQATNTNYITVITIENTDGTLMNGQNELVSYNWVTEILTVGTYEIALSPRERVTVDSVEMAISQDEVHLINRNQPKETKYAWYLINRSTGKAIERTGYSDNEEYTFILPDIKSEYLIKAYVMSPEGQRKSAIVKAIQYQDGVWKDVTSSFPHLNLRYLGQVANRFSDTTYQFQVEYQYSENISIAWYIYRNGGGYDYRRTDGGLLEYTFEEPGIYDVMYYIRTWNGDNLFYNFEEIAIR